MVINEKIEVQRYNDALHGIIEMMQELLTGRMFVLIGLGEIYTVLSFFHLTQSRQCNWMML